MAWMDDRTGYNCYMIRNEVGAWAGYVALLPGHPMYGKEMEEFRGSVAHGGITFAQEIHIANFGDEVKAWGFDYPADVFWMVGFDCMHPLDHAPGMDEAFKNMPLRIPLPKMIYRDKDYVQASVRQLAAQMEEVYQEHVGQGAQ